MHWRLPRLLLVVGWFFLVVGAVALLGHILTGRASTPELGKYGGWILDALSLTAGVTALMLRRWLLRRPGS